MSSQYSGNNHDEQRDQAPTGRGGDTFSCSGAISVIAPSYGTREQQQIQSTGRRSISAMSKDMARTLQSSIQNNTGSIDMQPRLQKLASVAQSVQHSAIVDNVNSGFSSVNNKLNSMIRRSNSMSSASLTTSSDRDRGIYAHGGSARAWGSAMSAEISTFTTKKVVPFLRRQNTCPENYTGMGNMKGTKEISFDYQLMKDNE